MTKCESCQKTIKGRQVKYRIHPVNNKLYRYNNLCAKCWFDLQKAKGYGKL